MPNQPFTIDPHAAERLSQEPIIWLGSVRPDQRPHLVPVWFTWDGKEEIAIFSKPGNQKIRNIRQNGQVALALNTADGGDDVVLIEGVAEAPANSTRELQMERPELATAYIEKYDQSMTQMGLSMEAVVQEYSQPILIKLTRVVSWNA